MNAPSFDVGRPAPFQRPLRRVKHKPHQDRFILATVADDHFWLAAYELTNDGQLDLVDETKQLPYLCFWSHIAALQLDDRKWWMIGWRMRYLLHRAEFLSALEDGSVTLPIMKRKSGAGKRSGKLTLSPNCCEVDMVVGKHRIKVLDWDNFGVLSAAFGVDLESIYPLALVHALQDYLAICTQTGLSFSRTSAAQIGWAKFRSDCLPDTLAVNLDITARDFERQAYFGGRNEAFFLGNVPGVTYSLDVKSCYAHVCQHASVPVWLDAEFRAGCSVDKLDGNGIVHWIADVILKTDTADYPLRWDGSPIYPVGEFRTTLCWPELRHALEHGRVLRVLRAARYYAAPAMQRFGQWVQASKEKLAAFDVDRLKNVLKVTFNAALGYSARRHYQWQPWETQIGCKWLMGIMPAPDHSTPVVACHILDGDAEWLRVGGEPRESLPMIHATICSWARVRLLELMNIAGRENVLYVDTDGMLTNFTGKYNLEQAAGIMGDSPGQVCERFTPGVARIQGQKNYRIGENFVAAGLVRTRYSGIVEKEVLACNTGMTTADGKVFPYMFSCEDEGGEGERIVNHMS